MSSAMGYGFQGQGQTVCVRPTHLESPNWLGQHEMDLRQQGVPASSLPLMWDVEQIESSPLSTAATTATEDAAGRRNASSRPARERHSQRVDVPAGFARAR